MVEIFDNIRKLYLFRAPCEELAGYVEFFSESSSEATLAFAGNHQFSVKMFSSWTPTFWINLGTSYGLTLGNERFIIPPGKDILITRDTTVERNNLAGDYIFTLKFYPGGLETVLGIDQSKLAGRLIDLHDILPTTFLLRIRNAIDFEERIQLFENFLLSRMKAKAPRAYYTELVKKTIMTYERGSMKYNVDELSARLFVTSKTINRYFNNVIGITPKNYLSIIRSRAALTAYVTDRKNFTPSDFGYYDMSHFYKEIIKFTGERMIVHTS
jgi:AraC-like DNA-binding protein